MNDIEVAKKMLDDGEYTCVLCKGDTVYTSCERGISPLLCWLDMGLDMKGFFAADKIIGKAAAMLFILAGVHEVYAPVMSEGAIQELSKHAIISHCLHSVDKIINRKGDGQCPMEQTVAEISDPQKAYEALKQKVDELRNRV